MKTLCPAIVFVLAIGCGPDLETLKKDACACKDSKCVEGVVKEARDLEARFDDTKPTAAEAKLLDEIGACMTNAVMGSRERTTAERE